MLCPRSNFLISLISLLSDRFPLRVILLFRIRSMTLSLHSLQKRMCLNKLSPLSRLSRLSTLFRSKSIHLCLLLRFLELNLDFVLICLSISLVSQVIDPLDPLDSPLDSPLEMESLSRSLLIDSVSRDMDFSDLS